MDRRRTLASLVVLGAASKVGLAQPPKRVPRVGYLTGNMASTPHLRAAFVQGLHDLGYIDGRTIVIDYRDAGGREERLDALAADLVAQKPDVIFAAGTQHVIAAKRATSIIPIVFADVADPVERGFVASLARPGGNVTGLANLQTDLVGKWLELLKQIVPRLERAAFLWQPRYLPERAQKDVLTHAQAAAEALAIRLQVVEVREADDLDRAFAEMTRAKVGAVAVWGGLLFIRERQRIADLAARSRLPSSYPMSEFVDAGGLVSYAPNIADNFRRAATYVDRILKGSRAADLPVEQASRLELVINLKTARALGMTIPPAILNRADRVIA